MKHIVLIMAFALSVTPVMAQEAAPSETEEGLSLLEEGAGLLLRGLMSEMEPAMQDMAEALEQAEPMLRELLAKMDDLTHYEMPEILPNGDIIIRRKPDVEPVSPEIEL